MPTIHCYFENKVAAACATSALNQFCSICTAFQCLHRIWDRPARAIINQPKLILADEPTGALDSHSSQMLLSTIQSINEDLGATILMVTHDAFSASYANRILFMRDGAIFTEIRKGGDSRRTFFEKILDVLTMMGGGMSDVR